MADLPKYLGAVNVKAVSIASANTDRTGASGTKYAANTAGSNGAVMHKITVEAVGTTTEGVVRIFMDTADGLFLVKEIDVTAVDLASSPDSEAFSAEVEDWGLIMPPSASLYVTTHKSEAFHVTIAGQDY